MDILSMQNVSLSFGSTRALDGLSSVSYTHLLFGVLAARLGIGLLPAFLLAGVAGMLLCAERVRTLCGR